jgi:hypothetical protein
MKPTLTSLLNLALTVGVVIPVSPENLKVMVGTSL